ncbi:MAG: DUF1192 domain-containing protein [Pseudomonadota bacterium]
MDLEDVFPDPKKEAGPSLGEDLSALSRAELDERIAALRDEILRVEAEITARKSHMSAAEQAFKS